MIIRQEEQMRVSSDFRELARRALSGKWGSAVLTTLVASILGADIAMAGGPKCIKSYKLCK